MASLLLRPVTRPLTDDLALRELAGGFVAQDEHTLGQMDMEVHYRAAGFRGGPGDASSSPDLAIPSPWRRNAAADRLPVIAWFSWEHHGKYSDDDKAQHEATV